VLSSRTRERIFRHARQSLRQPIACARSVVSCIRARTMSVRSSQVALLIAEIVESTRELGEPESL
jgi:hypothetical protein